MQTFVEGEKPGCSGLKYWAEGQGLTERNTQAFWKYLLSELDQADY